MAWDVVASKEEIALLMEAGFLYRDGEKFDEARDVFRGVRALSPKSEVPEVALGTVSFHARDFEGAIAHYQEALKLNPQSAYAYAHLGEAELFRMDKKAARGYLKKALELDPKGEFGKMARSLTSLADEVKYK
jgi:tetratricopeptide (TPR) repeat protein